MPINVFNPRPSHNDRYPTRVINEATRNAIRNVIDISLLRIASLPKYRNGRTSNLVRTRFNSEATELSFANLVTVRPTPINDSRLKDPNDGGFGGFIEDRYRGFDSSMEFNSYSIGATFNEIDKVHLLESQRLAGSSEKFFTFRAHTLQSGFDINKVAYSTVFHESVHLAQLIDLGISQRELFNAIFEDENNRYGYAQSPHEVEAFDLEAAGGRFLRSLVKTYPDILSIDDSAVRTSTLLSFTKDYREQQAQKLREFSKDLDPNKMLEVQKEVELLDEQTRLLQQQLADLERRFDQPDSDSEGES